MTPSIIILTRTYYKDGTILQNNLLSTADVFINRKKYSIGVILDNESIEDHNLGNKLINNKKIDNIYYEDLPNNNHELFQALAYPNMHWGYDRQQWSTFYMDTFVNHDIIGIVDSDSTFTTYLTDENIFTNDGKIKIMGIKPLKSWVHWSNETKWYKFKDGAQHENDDIALQFQTIYDCMATNIMPFFFWKTSFNNFRKYIESVWNMPFDEAYKIFSKKPYCQFNIMVNYVLKFELDKYEFIDLSLPNNSKVSVAQNGCPSSMDVLCGFIQSFNIPNNKINNLIPKSSKCSSFGNVPIHLNYLELLNNVRHANNFAFFINSACNTEYIKDHYSNVLRDINNLSIEDKQLLEMNIENFLSYGFNNIIIKG